MKQKLTVTIRCLGRMISETHQTQNHKRSWSQCFYLPTEYKQVWYWREVNISVFLNAILVLLMFCDTWICAFLRVIGPIDFNAFHVCEFWIFVVLCFVDCNECFNVVSNTAFLILAVVFEAKIESHDFASWWHDFGGSPRTKIMRSPDVVVFYFPRGYQQYCCLGEVEIQVFVYNTIVLLVFGDSWFSGLGIHRT